MTVIFRMHVNNFFLVNNNTTEIPSRQTHEICNDGDSISPWIKRHTWSERCQVSSQSTRQLIYNLTKLYPHYICSTIPNRNSLKYSEREFFYVICQHEKKITTYVGDVITVQQFFKSKIIIINNNNNVNIVHIF